MPLATPPAPCRAGVLPLLADPELLLAPRVAVVAGDLEEVPVKEDVVGEVILLEEGLQQSGFALKCKLRQNVRYSAISVG